MLAVRSVHVKLLREVFALLSSASIKSGIVATLVAHGLDTGVAIAPWFEGMRVGPRDFTGPQGPPYLTYREACRVIQRALAALPGEGLGLLLGGRQSLGEFGLLGLAMMASPNFGEAMRTAVRFAPVTGSMLDLAVVDWSRAALIPSETERSWKELPHSRRPMARKPSTHRTP